MDEAGLVGALALTRVMASLLFGVNALDWITFSSVSLMLVIVAFGATVIPGPHDQDRPDRRVARRLATSSERTPTT